MLCILFQLSGQCITFVTLIHCEAITFKMAEIESEASTQLRISMRRLSSTQYALLDMLTFVMQNNLSTAVKETNGKH